MSYTCSRCLYSTNSKYDYNRHLQSKRHNKETDLNIFSCEQCNYSTNVKQDYMRHCISQRHKDRNKTFSCNTCNKTYKTRNGLYKHKKKHIETQISNTTNQEWKCMIIDYIKENNELQNTLIKENMEIKNKLLNIAEQPKVIHQKNTFNIVNYLNTQCKDAYNLTDFIENLVVTFDDLERIEQHGYFHGVKNSLVLALQQLEQNKRPIHCTDVKRKQFYVKDDNEWKKDKTKMMINKAINSYNNKQLKTLLDSGLDEDAEFDLRQQDKMNKITQELTQMYAKQGGKLKEKIVHEICDATIVDKNTLI